MKKCLATCRSSDHTYLLKNVGAEYKDNVYILYGSGALANTNSGIDGYNYVTCVVDDTGIVRFTIPSFVSGDKFIVVKVWPE